MARAHRLCAIAVLAAAGMLAPAVGAGSASATGRTPFASADGLSAFQGTPKGFVSAAGPAGWVGPGVDAYGDAANLGPVTGTLRAPAVAIVSTPDGKGYWVATAAGEVRAFGDARALGGLTAAPNAPVVGMAATPDGGGYWLAASDGGVFTFGDAPFLGSAADQDIGTWVVGIQRTTGGKGYWLAAATGGVLTYGDAQYFGPTPNLPPFSPATAMAATPDGGGYWLLRQDEIGVSFSTALFAGPTIGGGPTIVGNAASQLGPNGDAAHGPFCNPYGPCEEWCALFATWAWESGGIPIPRYPFTGSIFGWGLAHGHVLPPWAVPAPGDMVLYGTGPQNASTSVHVGIVAQVWPDGAIDTIEGDSGPEPEGQFAVTVNGPFLPLYSQEANGMPVYAFVAP